MIIAALFEYQNSEMTWKEITIHASNKSYQIAINFFFWSLKTFTLVTHCPVLKRPLHRNLNAIDSYESQRKMLPFSCDWITTAAAGLHVPLKRLWEGLRSECNVLMVSACSHVSSELCLITIFTKSDRVWFLNAKHPGR